MAEAAVTGLYRLIGQPPPEFVRVPSPAAAREVMLAPGRYVVRSQRERNTEARAWFGNRMIAD